ncbi:MAG: PDZ domain-containing protein [Pseudomonadota bacterium]
MITYHIDARDTHAHVFHVRVTVAQPAARQRLSLPVWIPGSYMVREFSRHLFQLEAHQGNRVLSLSQIDKATWEVACEGSAALTLRYSVYAFDTSVRAAYLGTQRGFFNGTSLCLQVDGRTAEPHQVRLTELPPGWEVGTALPAVKVDRRGRGTYQAADYDELIDHPVELGTFWRGHFEAQGVPHEIIVCGALPDFDKARLLADTQRICEAEIAFWHTNKRAPFERYVFLLNTVDEGFGGLEHRASTALICGRRDLPQRGRAEVSDGYLTLLGLISHEYFHTWNVKRLRPSEFGRYDLHTENYTELLWFFEGFTSYYDDLFLVRSGLIDEPRYLKLLSKNLSHVLSTPGRQVQSVAQSSFDAWIKYYRPDENSVNLTVSYYAKGALVALALDLSLRAAGNGSLDEVMRALWLRSAGGPISESDILGAVDDIAVGSLSTALQAWVHGTDDFAWMDLLAPMGLTWQAQPPSLAQRWGLKVSESALTGVKVSQVLRAGLGEQVGLCAGDELLGVNQWRVRRLEDATRLLVSDQPGQLLVCRDQALLTLTLPAGAALVGTPGQGELAPQGQLMPRPTAQAPRTAAALRKAWLSA